MTTKTEKAPTKFSCHCSQTCEAGVSWFARAPLDQCYTNDKPCKCGCHASAVGHAEALKACPRRRMALARRSG